MQLFNKKICGGHFTQILVAKKHGKYNIHYLISKRNTIQVAYEIFMILDFRFKIY